MQNILAIDDDLTFLESIKKLLELNSYKVDTLSNPFNAENYLSLKKYDLILCDVKMPGIDGRLLLKKILEETPSLPVVMISGQSTIEIAVECIKMGALDFIEKPLDPDRLLIVVAKAINNSNIKESNANLFNELSGKYQIVGDGAAVQKLKHNIQKISDTPAKVLIQGETGTGKELVAWALHHNSQRKNKPYIRVNCAAIPKDLLESELFGYEKGAFTGAEKAKPGKFSEADGGTIFLDEIGDLDLNLQSKLLRVLEEQEIEVIGNNHPVKIDVRIISASNVNLHQKIDSGQFRLDLFHRLNVVNINVPPLRERKEDIHLLVDHFIKVFSEQYNKQIVRINQNAIGLLKSYHWPGNIRELKNIIEKIVIFNLSDEIKIEDVIDAFEECKIKIPKYLKFEYENLFEARESFEKEHILNLLEQYNWKIGETAEKLGIDRTSLFRKMQKYNIVK